MAKIFAQGLYKLSIALLVFSCLGFVFGIISLANDPNKQSILSFLVSILQITVCALGIHGAKTYSFPALLIGAIGCGIVFCIDLVLAILWGLIVAAIVAGTAISGGGAGAVAVSLWLAVILLVFPLLFFILYLVEFILFIRHAKRAHGSSPSEYVTV